MAHTRTNLLIFQSISMRPQDGVRLTSWIAVPRGGKAQGRRRSSASISFRNNTLPLFVIAVGFSVRRTRRRAM